MALRGTAPASAFVMPRPVFSVQARRGRPQAWRREGHKVAAQAYGGPMREARRRPAVPRVPPQTPPPPPPPEGGSRRDLLRTVLAVAGAAFVGGAILGVRGQGEVAAEQRKLQTMLEAGAKGSQERIEELRFLKQGGRAQQAPPPYEVVLIVRGGGGAEYMAHLDQRQADRLLLLSAADGRQYSLEPGMGKLDLRNELMMRAIFSSNYWEQALRPLE